MKVYAPNKAYTGVSASVAFLNGVGMTEDPNLLNWFRDRGYTIEEDPETPEDPEEPETPEEPEVPETLEVPEVPEDPEATPKKGKAATKKAGE